MDALPFFVHGRSVHLLPRIGDAGDRRHQGRAKAAGRAGRPDQAHRRPRRRARIRGPRPAEVREALRGEKIRAIKPHRDATGSDLTSAKEAVDRIESTGAQDTPS